MADEYDEYDFITDPVLAQMYVRLVPTYPHGNYPGSRVGCQRWAMRPDKRQLVFCRRDIHTEDNVHIWVSDYNPDERLYRPPLVWTSRLEEPKDE